MFNLVQPPLVVVMDKSTLYMKAHLVAAIEEKLGWGRGATWGNKDFEELSERILKRTTKRLSVTTLKRVWERAEWVADPSVASLDILSEFAGFENWRTFVTTQQGAQPRVSSFKSFTGIQILMSVLILLGLVSFFGFFWTSPSTEFKKNTPYHADDFTFKSRPVSSGLPNSVVFEYNAKAAAKDSKVEIQQDWDHNKRTIVNKEDSIATSIYFRPGFFKSKLVVDGAVVQEHDVFIPSNNWLGMIEQKATPIYLSTPSLYQDGKIAITPEIVAAHNLDPRTSAVKVSLYQVKDFGELYTDDFQMSALLKNDFAAGISACQFAQVFILYDGGAIGIPLANKGCVSALNLLTFEGSVGGKKNDLSAFGVDFSDFVLVQCISKNKVLEVLVNGEVAYQMKVPETPLKIKGISVHFEGAGSLKEVVFLKNKQVIYHSNFKNTQP